MTNISDVAVIGAGPYGLSLAAHLRGRGVDFRIFGKPLSTWRLHMPKDMLLKSEGFGSNLSSPGRELTLKSYCATHGIPYADQQMPIPLDVFIAYAQAFLSKFVPDLDQRDVTRIERRGDRFALTLEDGESLEARHVVLAVGITWFAHVPRELAGLPAGTVSHSFDHREGAPFANRDVVVLGAGASAIDLAALLHDSGARVRVLARAPALRFHSPPSPDADSLIQRIRKPPTTIGPGWRSLFCVRAPLLFRRLPLDFRLRAVRRHLGPAPGWFMRPRFEGHIPTLLGRSLVRAEHRDGKVVLEVTGPAGAMEKVVCDHVIAATGYRPDLGRLPFLAPELRAAIAAVEGAPILSDQFETSVRGLFVIGPAAANTFGPLMRFMTGSEFVAPRLARFLRRRVGSVRPQRAA